MMMSRVFNEKYNMIKKEHIKLIFFFIYFCMAIITIRFIWGTNSMENQDSMFLAYVPYYMGKLILVLCIIAYVSSLLYYYSNKDDTLFIISLVYLNLLVNIILNIVVPFYYNSEILFLSAYFRIIILICAANKNNKVLKILKKMIINNKLKSILIVVLCSILEISLDSLGFLNNIKYNKILLTIHLIMIIIGYIIFNILWVKKSLAKRDIVYTFIVSSIMFLSIRRIYLVLQGLFPSLYFFNNHDEVLIMITVTSLILLILGILFEVIKKVHKSNILEDELEAFYNLMEFNYHNSIVLFDKNKTLIYANERLRKQYSSSKSLDSKGQYKELKNFIEKTINEGNINIDDIIVEIEKKGAWKSTLNVKRRFMRVECQKLYVKMNKYYYAASISDVTDEYELHEKLNKSRPIIENLTENIQDLIVVTDNEFNITYVNSAITNTLGYSSNELIGTNIKNILEQEFTDKVINSIGSRVECGLFKKESNEILPVEAINNNVLGTDKAILGKILVFRDLTINNEFNSLTKRYNEVKAYEKSRSQFFANLSHEFKTPLNIFSSTIQLLDLKYDNDHCNFHDEYKKYRVGLKHNCNRMIRLISNIIDITKIDSGLLEGSFINYNIVELVENITMLIIPYAKIKNLNVVFDTLEEDIIIRCDLEKIERSILNLLSNAIKFTRAGGNIFIDICRDEEWVYIKIKDDGVGISLEMQQFIFERCVQVDKSLNRDNEGSGMGLCIVKSMIGLHDGEITLKSDGVSGSEFIIKLPNSIIYDTHINEVTHTTDLQKIELELSDIYELY